MIEHKPSPIIPKVIEVPAPAEDFGLETAQIHAAKAEDLLAHAHTLESMGENATEVYEQATNEFFTAHIAAGSDVESLGPEFFEGLAESEEAIASAEEISPVNREIAALHSISSLEYAIGIGGLSKIKTHRLRMKQHHLKDLVDKLDEEVPEEVVAAKKVPAVKRLRDAKTGHKTNLKEHTDRVRRAGARIVEKFFTDDTQVF